MDQGGATGETTDQDRRDQEPGGLLLEILAEAAMEHLLEDARRFVEDGLGKIKKKLHRKWTAGLPQ